MSKRWSKLKTRLYKLMDPAAEFQIHCVLYKMGQYGNRLSRYFITIGKDIVFDYPKDISLAKKLNYSWSSDVDEISKLIEEYIQCPKENLLNGFPNDQWGITDILIACDRRVGKKQLKKLLELTVNEKMQLIIEKRFNLEEL